MKKLQDLFNLILEETKLNEGKMQQNVFSIDTHYNWVSFTKVFNLGDEVKSEKILDNISIETEAELQQAYWTIYNNSRTANK